MYINISLNGQNETNYLGSNHPLLSTISNYYFNAKTGGKNLRPALVLLMSQATFNNDNFNCQFKDYQNQSLKRNSILGLGGLHPSLNPSTSQSSTSQSSTSQPSTSQPSTSQPYTCQSSTSQSSTSQSYIDKEKLFINQMDLSLNNHLIGSNWDSDNTNFNLNSILNESNSSKSSTVYTTREDYLKSRTLPTQQRLAGILLASV